MKSEWVLKKLSDIAIFNPKETIPTGKLAKKVAMDNLQPFCRDIPSYSIEKFNGGMKFRNNDTIMARITPCLENGKTAKVNILDNDEVGFGSTEYIVFRAIKGVTEEDFLYYLVCSALVREPAIKSMVGSSGRQRVQKDLVENLMINIPPLFIQKKLGALLTLIDDKIALNNRINNNLEQLAKALFEKFFITRKELPTGWKKGNLLDIANYLNGLPMQKYRPENDDIGMPVLKIKELRQGVCDNSSERCSSNIKPDFIISDGDVVFSWSGTLMVDFWCGGAAGLNQHLFKVTSSKYDKWFYYSWTKYHLNKFIALASAMATTMGHIKRNELATSEVIIPTSDDYLKIGGVLQPIYDLIIKNRIETIKLVKLRNYLLPKLMSGEIDVSKIEL